MSATVTFVMVLWVPFWHRTYWTSSTVFYYNTMIWRNTSHKYRSYYSLWHVGFESPKTSRTADACKIKYKSKIRTLTIYKYIGCFPSSWKLGPSLAASRNWTSYRLGKANEWQCTNSGDVKLKASGAWKAISRSFLICHTNTLSSLSLYCIHVVVVV